MADYSLMDPETLRLLSQGFGEPSPGVQQDLGKVPELSLMSKFGNPPPGQGLNNPGLGLSKDINTSITQPTLGEQIGQGLVNYAPDIMALGSTLMGGKETVGGQLAGVMQGITARGKLNEAMKKMLLSQLGGGKSFNEGQAPTLSSVDVSGLTPEQVTGLYGTAMKTREEEMARPFKELTALAGVADKIAEAEGRPATAKLHLAVAEHNLAQANQISDPTLRYMAIMKALDEREKVKAETIRITKTGEEQVALATKHGIETKKLTQELSPEYLAFKKRIETEYGTKLEEVRLGNKVNLTNPITGKTVSSYEVGPTPETTGKINEERKKDIDFAYKRMMPYVMPALKNAIAGNPKEKNMQALGDLLNLMKPTGTGELDTQVIMSYLAAHSELRKKFEQTVDDYMYLTKKGVSETVKGQMATETLLGKSVTLTPTPPGTEQKTVIGRELSGKKVSPPPASVRKQPMTMSEIATSIAPKAAVSGNGWYGDGSGTEYHFVDGKIIDTRTSGSASTLHLYNPGVY